MSGSRRVGRKASPVCDLQGTVLFQAVGLISNSADRERSCLPNFGTEPTGALFPPAKPKLVNGNHWTSGGRKRPVSRRRWTDPQ